MRKKCEKIVQHGINCFINRQLIYNFPESIFTGAGVVSIEHADFDGAFLCAIIVYLFAVADVFDFSRSHTQTHTHTHIGIERIAAVTGGEIASTFDKPELVKLGKCDLIDEVMIGEDKLIRFSGCAGGQACTIVLRGASSHLLGE